MTFPILSLYIIVYSNLISLSLFIDKIPEIEFLYLILVLLCGGVGCILVVHSPVCGA